MNAGRTRHAIITPRVETLILIHVALYRRTAALAVSETRREWRLMDGTVDGGVQIGTIELDSRR